MTRKDIARRISINSHGTRDIVNLWNADLIVEKFLFAAQQVLTETGRLELRGFGTFEVLERKSKKARNPKTGDVVMVPARLDVRFRPSSEMLKQITS